MQLDAFYKLQHMTLHVSSGSRGNPWYSGSHWPGGLLCPWRCFEMKRGVLVFGGRAQVSIPYLVLAAIEIRRYRTCVSRILRGYIRYPKIFLSVKTEQYLNRNTSTRDPMDRKTIR